MQERYKNDPYRGETDHSIHAKAIITTETLGTIPSIPSIAAVITT